MFSLGVKGSTRTWCVILALVLMLDASGGVFRLWVDDVSTGLTYGGLTTYFYLNYILKALNVFLVGMLFLGKLKRFLYRYILCYVFLQFVASFLYTFHYTGWGVEATIISAGAVIARYSLALYALFRVNKVWNVSFF